ncbi:hypothetical protein D3C72_2027650 [compost metagenome]
MGVPTSAVPVVLPFLPSVKRRVLPGVGRGNITVLDGIHVDVLDAGGQFAFIAYGMFPKAPLPDAAFAFPVDAAADGVRAQRPGKPRLYPAPAARVVGVACGQPPDHVQMVGQQYRRQHRERRDLLFRPYAGL